MDWTLQELKHIQRLETYMNKNKDILFGTNSKQSKEKKDRYAMRWIKYAQQKLGWDKRLAAAISCSIYPLDGKTGDVIMPS